MWTRERLAFPFAFAAAEDVKWSPRKSDRRLIAEPLTEGNVPHARKLQTIGYRVRSASGFGGGARSKNPGAAGG